ncbi:MAG: DNA adenine methylase [Planctomycetaceae bacterium]|jgi:DNA adenine methylase|nr:DNA adenine methylase [Planctomycetaceae bacterium]
MGYKGMVKPPIRYYGGKFYQAAWILDVIERYQFKTYIEPFGGSGAILFAKKPSPVEIYNDIYSDLVTLYKVLRNPKTYKDLIRFLENSPYSRELFGESKDVLSNKKLSTVERAGHFFIVVRQSFSGLRISWSSAGKVGKPKSTPYCNAIDRLPEVHERLRHVHIEHKDAIDCIKLYADTKSLIYCDPPYVSDTRVSPATYKHEYTDEQHERLIETLLAVPGHKILSGYQSSIYEPLLDAGWTLHKKQFACYASPNKKTRRTECLYCSPTEAITNISD